ncbi:fimbrillin family protein [Sphingobacterium corticibacter]|nr:fimbrillin family protein [Sphingobacterium corticibacter]
MNSRNLLAGAIALFTLLTISACSKESSSAVSGDANVTIELLGSEMEAEEVNNSRAATHAGGDVEEEQTKVISLENNFQLVATLTPRANASASEANGNDRKAAATQNRAATTVRTPLATGVKYRVLAYLGDNYVGKMDYEVGKAPIGFDKLRIGSTYTFIAYSVNSSAELPEVSNGTKLSTASFTSSEDLMYFRSTLKISEGDNYLGIILKHQFSQITMTTRLTDDSRGDIVSLTNVRFTGRGNRAATPRKNGTVKLSNGTLSYTTDTASVAINYPNLGGGLRSVTASPTLLISPQVTTTDVVIGNLLINATINGKQVSTVRNNLVLEDFLISPYQKYDLVLQIKNPCTEPTGDDTFEWRSQNGTVKTNTLYASGANYGYTFDIYELDNSFNMEINGQKLATKEIQFEYTTASNLPKRNVKFADGGIWGQGNVFEIWNIIGNKDYPSVKLVISAKGEVSLFGRKNNTDRALYPIVFSDDTKFNKINWNTTGQNKVVITQSVINITVMHGRGYGVRVIPCPAN